MIYDCLVVGIGGAVGSILRYMVGMLPIKNNSGFPITTLFINIFGSFCIGFIVAAAGKHTNLNSRWILFLKVGICGGFTTFSTFSLESLRLFQDSKSIIGLIYVLSSVIFGIIAVFLGQMIAG